MKESRLRDFARSLGAAWAEVRAIPAPSTVDPSLTPEQAYEIQEMIVEERMRGGRERAGWKMGLTTANPPTTPIVGTLLSDMVIATGSDLDVGSMVSPMVEAELVVRIGETIDRAQTVEELVKGPHQLGPGIEVIDYRTTDSNGVVDWIADNSTVAYAVVGEFKSVTEVRPVDVTATLSGNGERLASGSGRQVMGNPLAAVAWLSGHLSGRGLALEKGHVVLTGSLTGHHTVPRDGDSEFSADFDTLGPVRVSFHT
jgi:2-keto-4-pentenoate hydratase